MSGRKEKIEFSAVSFVALAGMGKGMEFSGHGALIFHYGMEFFIYKARAGMRALPSMEIVDMQCPRSSFGGQAQTLNGNKYRNFSFS